MGFFQFLGQKVINFFREFGKIFTLLYRIISYFSQAFRNKRLVFEQMAIIGADSLPLVLLIGSFTGAIAALQATSLFDKFNMMEIARPFLGASISTVVFQELTPVLTALVIAGRIGASMTAQIGSMQVTEQIDALEIMAIDKNRYLGMPRVLAALLMMPILAIFSSIIALLGAFIMVALKFNINASLYFESIKNFFVIKELIVCLTKSALFGGITALIGVYVGFSTTGGAEGVGYSAVKSFTISAASILILDALLGTIL